MKMLSYNMFLVSQMFFINHVIINIQNRKYYDESNLEEFGL